MDLDKAIMQGAAVRATPGEAAAVPRLKMRFPLTRSALEMFERKGVDLGRWGIVKRMITQPVGEADADGKQATEVITVYENATFDVRELSVDELKAASGMPEAEAEKHQITKALVRFGTMDVERMQYELDVILAAGGFVLHALILSCSNAAIFPKGMLTTMQEAQEASQQGKFV